jgi:acyl-CoA dehydrogenase
MPDQTNTMLQLTAGRVFTDHITARELAAAESGAWPAAAWTAIESAGLARALLPEAAGGYGVEPAEALSILTVAGAHALPLPLPETMLAGWLLAGAGLALPDGPLSVAPVRLGDALALTPRGAGWHLSGTVRRIPWGRNITALAALAMHRGAPMVALVPATGWTVRPAANLALEPRDTLDIAVDLPAAAVAPAGPDGGQLRAVGAALRSQQIAGALGQLVAMTTQYALDRTQFGRPIGKFQAVQHNLALLAGQAAAAAAAADGAAEAVSPLRLLPIAAAKQRCGEAAGIGAAIAHQVHGAIGFTYEHSLHYLTKRLWSWRDEFGSETEWAALLGRHMAEAGPDRLWLEITAA